MTKFPLGSVSRCLQKSVMPVWVSLSLYTLLTGAAYGADIRSMSVVAPRSAADGRAAHAVDLSVKSQNNVGTSFVRTGEEQDFRLTQASEARVGYGFDVNENVSLKLGLKRSQEAYRLANDMDTIERRSFATAIAEGQFTVVKQSMFGLDLGIFAESGAGEKAQGSLAASEKASGGWLTTARIGEVRGFHLLGSAGYRYRSPEQFETYTLRHERLYGASIHAPVTREIGVYGGVEGRGVMVRETAGAPKYQAHNSSTMVAGIKAAYNNLLLTLFGGKALSQGAAFGQGQNHVGLAIEYRFDGVRMPRMAAAEKPEEGSSDDILSYKCEGTGPLCEKTPVDLVQDVNTGVVDRDGDVGEKDEFQLLEERRKAEQAKLTEEDRNFERDIEAAKLQRKREEQEEARRHKLAQENERRLGKTRMKRDMKAAAKYRKEVKEEVDAMPEITDEEVNWRGLE